MSGIFAAAMRSVVNLLYNVSVCVTRFPRSWKSRILHFY